MFSQYIGSVLIQHYEEFGNYWFIQLGQGNSYEWCDRFAHHCKLNGLLFTSAHDVGSRLESPPYLRAGSPWDRVVRFVEKILV